MFYNSIADNRLYRVVRPMCAALFMLFVFFFLLCEQGEVLARAQFVFSHGITSYSLWWGAFLIPLVLLMLQWVVARIIILPVRFHALTYFPPMLCLAMLSSLNEEVMLDFSFRSWIWIAPLLLVVYAALIILVRKFTAAFSNEKTLALSDVLWPNAFIMLALIIFCGCVSNSKDVYHYELKTERLILERKYDKAIEVANREYTSSRRLTQLRMYALARLGLLGECLFDFPQYYGGEGLLDIHNCDTTQRFTNYDIYLHLGVAPDGKTVMNLGRLLAIANANDSLRNKRTMDYELCNALLERNLNLFSQLLPRYYGTDVPLPRSYREAVIYVQTRDSLALPGYTVCDETRNQFWQYESRKQELTDPIERRNRTRREFGRTFWWYYENKISEPDYTNP